MDDQCTVMLVTKQCPNPAVEGFDKCIVHLGSGGFAHWFAAAKAFEDVATKTATYIGYAAAVWHVISPLLKADQLGERAAEYARIERGLESIVDAAKADPKNPRTTPLENELETLVIDFYNFVNTVTATAEDNELMTSDRS
jgi:hypothetical protein